MERIAMKADFFHPTKSAYSISGIPKLGFCEAAIEKQNRKLVKGSFERLEGG
jgi:hypothetical protein